LHAIDWEEDSRADRIEFVSNYSDRSTHQGFQFEFYCNRCGSGYRTPFKAWAVGAASAVLDTASGLFGGTFGSAASIGERVRSVTWEKAHDEAFAAASEEPRPSFAQCPRCCTWVCRESYWNAKRGLCKGCAPDLGVEMSAAQASRLVEEVWARAAMDDVLPDLAAMLADRVQRPAQAVVVELLGRHRKTSRTMPQINQTRACAYRDFVANLIWNRFDKFELCNPYFATKGAIPRVWFSIRLLMCEI
jgi:hypothetical protein